MWELWLKGVKKLKGSYKQQQVVASESESEPCKEPWKEFWAVELEMLKLRGQEKFGMFVYLKDSHCG